jgi:hypothetical protein
MMLECPGVFTVPFIPESWVATGRPGEFYQIEPPESGAAVHISVYSRPQESIGEHEARDLVAAFATKAVGVAGSEIRVPRNSPAEQRAYSRFTRPNEDGASSDWFVACIVWPHAMLMCSYNGPAGHTAYAEAERMLASIFPADRV